MIVSNFRGIELYGSFHTSILSGSKKDIKVVPFINLEEFIGQARNFSTFNCMVNRQVNSDEHGAELKVYKSIIISKFEGVLMYETKI